MRYIIRALKYFVYYCIFITILIYILVLARLVDSDISTMFVNGYDSLWQIAIIIAVFASIYPKIGFSKRMIHLSSNLEAEKPDIIKVMDRYDYKIETCQEDNSKICFIKRSPLHRALKLWEDRVTFVSMAGGLEIEGLTKDILRIKSALEALRDESL